MNEEKSFLERLRSDPITHLIAALSLVIGLIFAGIQIGKLIQPDAAQLSMKTLPIGLMDWGFVWADTILVTPLLIIGALCLLGGSKRFGRILTFSGWTVNLYSTLIFIIGFQALKNPLAGSELLSAIISILLALICMAWLLWTLKDPD